MIENFSTGQAVPCPPPIPFGRISLLIPVDQTPSRTIPQLDSGKGREALARKRAEWSQLTLRRDFADAAFMRRLLVTAGIRVPNSNEPATPTRVKSILRRVWVSRSDIVQAVGTTATGFLGLNRGLPLWAAVALILEATGRFTSQAAE